MQQLITKYLFQNGHCPLPSLGELVMGTGSAVTDFSNRQIEPPIPFIKLNKEIPDAAGVVAYISAKTGKPLLEVEDSLFNYCKEIKDKVNNGDAVPFAGVGTFLKDGSGQLAFEVEKLPAIYFKPVPAERVVHPDASHTMKVGDTETTSTEMEAYFADEPAVKKDRWWIWALILGLAALAISCFHLYNNPGHTGNQLLTEPQETHSR